ncbi:hypothetical protein H6768_03850 [Candidatus Peribacteria bacterium]|nr:hypothetical protein [Candidatus Peribacteria bacterium]
MYASDGQEGTCKSYTLTQFVFDGQKFVQDHVYTTKYSYKTIFDLSGASHPDSFTEGCIMTDKNTRKLEYIRDDAVNNKYPSVVQS